GVVVGVAPHLLEVVVLAADAQALLRVHGAPVGARLVTEEDLLEGHHARVGEEQARVVLGYQRRARHHGVAALAEEVEEALADLIAGHENASSGSVPERQLAARSVTSGPSRPSRVRHARRDERVPAGMGTAAGRAG